MTPEPTETVTYSASEDGLNAFSASGSTYSGSFSMALAAEKSPAMMWSTMSTYLQSAWNSFLSMTYFSVWTPAVTNISYTFWPRTFQVLRSATTTAALLSGNHFLNSSGACELTPQPISNTFVSVATVKALAILSFESIINVLLSNSKIIRGKG